MKIFAFFLFFLLYFSYLWRQLVVLCFDLNCLLPIFFLAFYFLFPKDANICRVGVASGLYSKKAKWILQWKKERRKNWQHKTNTTQTHTHTHTHTHTRKGNGMSEKGGQEHISTNMAMTSAFLTLSLFVFLFSLTHFTPPPSFSAPKLFRPLNQTASMIPS